MKIGQGFKKSDFDIYANLPYNQYSAYGRQAIEALPHPRNYPHPKTAS